MSVLCYIFEYLKITIFKDRGFQPGGFPPVSLARYWAKFQQVENPERERERELLSYVYIPKTSEYVSNYTRCYVHNS